MNEKDLGRALLRGEDPIDIQAMTDRVLRRDRRRMWFLGIACVIAWMLVVMLPWSTIMPMMAKVVEQAMENSRNTSRTTAEQQEQAVQLAMVVKGGTMATFFGSIASMFVAAICTVSLIILSRRATMRQVNARLGEISAQLRTLAKESK
jgi:cell division protein FtsL